MPVSAFPVFAVPSAADRGLNVSTRLNQIEQGRLALWPRATDASRLPPRTVTRGRTTVTMANIYAWPVSPLPSNFLVATPSAPGGPLVRSSWDVLPPVAVSVADWATARFVDYPQGQPTWLGVYTIANPVTLPGLSPWTGLETLSSRERQWIFAPVVRHVRFCGFASRDQLAKRAQYREAILVTRAGRKPPAGHECLECSRILTGTSGGHPAFVECISGGIGQKCNNCLYRSTICSLQG
ncbi:hypothetical protein BDV19DRAFT_396042 [Aspergillus venezuelensis]